MEWGEKVTERTVRLKARLGKWRILVGVVFLLLGLLFMITPFTPGTIVLLLIGLELLGIRIIVMEWIYRYRIGNRWPKD